MDNKNTILYKINTFKYYDDDLTIMDSVFVDTFGKYPKILFWDYLLDNRGIEFYKKK